MIYGSVCSGIEAATVAWHPLGWRAAYYAEIEPFPCALLNAYYPTVPNHGDMTKFKEWPDATLDLLVGGTPCQSFSVAGLRKGLDDPRGNLTLTYLAVAHKYRPRWLVWENVPGVLSDGTGAFGALLGGLAKLGYGFAYRVLDAQYFRVAQQRRRVFVVGCARGWQRAAAVLLERSSLRGDSAPSREAGKTVAGTLGPSSSSGRSYGSSPIDKSLIAAPDIARCIATREGSSQDYETTTMVAQPVAHVDVMPTMLNGANTPAGHNARSGHSKDSYVVPVHAFDARQSDVIQYGDRTGPLDTCGFTIGVQTAMAVRRLTPRECERLQGFPDDYTLIEYKRKPAKDGPRYKALGNSMAVPVMRWIGERIQAVDQIREAA